MAVAATRADAGSAPGPADALRTIAKRTGPVYLRDRQMTAADADETLAPYFHVPGGSGEQLPLKETGAEVDITGVIARVRVRQVYENHSKTPIEAVYVFPASTRAAVHGMRMKIGSRTIQAKIERRAKAREDYERARSIGQRASLLEQQRENVFTMNVANLMPNDRIEVELDYSELLVPDEGVYEFVYPTVVGPRYGGGADPDKDRWIASPYQHQGQAETYRFDVSAHLRTSIPLKDVASPSHPIDVSFAAPSVADVRLKQPGGGNRDFVLRYRLAGDRIETGVLLWDGPGGGTFALMMEPPRRPAESDIPPREFVFLLDVSGSMNGFPLDTAKRLMDELLSSLRPVDRFNVVLFAGASSVMSPESVAATEANVRAAMDVIDRQRGGGGTELMAGLEAAYGVRGNDPGVSRTVVVVTDGYVGVEAQAFRFIREHLDDANLFAFGIGSSVNRALIEGMARAGVGEPFVVLRADKAEAEAARFRAMIDRPVLTDIRIKFAGLDAYDVLPDPVPDLLANRPLVLMGRYRGRPDGSVEIRGRTGGGAFRETVAVRASDARAEHAALGWLWARRWVAMLDDEITLGSTQALVDAVTDIGLRHSLLTRFTSFVAIDSQVVNRGGRSETVSQPLPMPEGVSDLAVGHGQAAMPAMKAMRAVPVGPMHLMSEGGSYGRGAASAVGDDLDALLLGATGERHARRERANSAPAASPKPRPVGPEVTRLLAEAVRDPDVLRRAVVEALGAAPCGAGTIRARLTLDRSGKVLSVEILEGPETAGRCVAARLRGLATGARMRGRSPTTVELTLRLP
jgi:Ca-activated chloride channel family protein